MPNFRKLVGDALEAATGIRAFHASPHDFEKFDISKIGTGQGAASYGKGIYAAENPKVSGPGGEYWQEFARRTPTGTPEYQAQQTLQRAGFDRAKALQLIEDDINSYPQDKLFKQARDLLADPTAKAGPRVYEININAPRSDFLKWDKPLAGQSAAVNFPALVDAAKREAYDRALSATNKTRADELWSMVKNPEQATGEFGYRGLLGPELRGTHRLEARDAIMPKMRDAGIPGIEYYDQYSRQNAGFLREAQDAVTNVERQGRIGTPEHEQWLKQVQHYQAKPMTSNFVLHSDDISDILKKYGIAVPAAGVAADQAQYTGQQ
jgi:hypothetical protein